MTAGPLSARVAALCDQLVPALAPDAAGRVRAIRRRLDEPLRVAVAGRLKAGKSTLVNALVGRRIAPTEAGECTRVVTQFRYGPADRVDVVRRDGTRVSLPLDEHGMIPRRLGVPRDGIAYVDATLPCANLRELTVLDTPGLASTTAGVSAGAREFLSAGGVTGSPLDGAVDADSAGAISGAEAILYVFTQAVRDDDVAALEAFRAVSARLASNPINSIGLFNKADKLVAGVADPWPVAGPLAADQGRVLRRVVSDVVPVVGLLAESAEAGAITAADCEALRALAALPRGDRLVLLASVDLFTGRDCPVPTAARRRLLRLLDLYGIGFAIAQLLARPTLGSGDLVRMLLAASGFAQVRHALDQTFRWRTDAIKAGWALANLERLAGRSAGDADREALRGGVESVVQQPDYHRLRLLDVAQQVTTGAVELPEPMERELSRLALSTDPRWILGLPHADPDELVRAALAAANRWRAYAVAGSGPAQSRVAYVGHRGFYLLSQAIRAAGGPVIGSGEAAIGPAGSSVIGSGGAPVAGRLGQVTDPDHGAADPERTEAVAP